VKNQSVFINFNSPAQNNFEMINNRIFDLISNGCFIITDDTPAQRELFKDCVEYSTGKEDLSEKLKYYLSNLDKIKEYQIKALSFSSEYEKNNSYE
jgi:spore maturation protein CgeB